MDFNNAFSNTVNNRISDRFYDNLNQPNGKNINCNIDRSIPSTGELMKPSCPAKGSKKTQFIDRSGLKMNEVGDCVSVPGIFPSRMNQRFHDWEKDGQLRDSNKLYKKLSYFEPVDEITIDSDKYRQWDLRQVTRNENLNFGDYYRTPNMTQGRGYGDKWDNVDVQSELRFGMDTRNIFHQQHRDKAPTDFRVMLDKSNDWIDVQTSMRNGISTNLPTNYEKNVSSVEYDRFHKTYRNYQNPNNLVLPFPRGGINTSNIDKFRRKYN